jgi:hypothetical protein
MTMKKEQVYVWKNVHFHCYFSQTLQQDLLNAAVFEHLPMMI